MDLVKLPGGERAVVDIEKLEQYCLNPGHRDGRHKARVFGAALGLSAADATWLREKLLGAAKDRLAVRTFSSEFGDHYMLDFILETPERQAMIRTGWIVRHGEDFPRFATCYVKKARTI